MSPPEPKVTVAYSDGVRLEVPLSLVHTPGVMAGDVIVSRHPAPATPTGPGYTGEEYAVILRERFGLQP